MMEDVFVGITSSYEDLYITLIFFAALYLVGDVFCRRVLKIVPSLVGHILVGILFGPEGFNLIQPSPETWVLFGNMGLVLLILQAGLEMDFDTLKVVGIRGVTIAIIGSILPIMIGTGIAASLLFDNGEEAGMNWKSALAAGCSFGPTSAGIAMNVLAQCNVLKSNVGQLIVAAAIVDDILALVVLSQLRAFTTTEGSVGDIVIPIVSAFSWLLVGGGVALFVFPSMYQKLIALLFGTTREMNKADSSTLLQQRVTLLSLFGLLLGLLPATYYTQASYLLGAFLSGLAFCRDSSNMDLLFRQQFKHVMTWLMKIFFAATIGFQVPARSFASGIVVTRAFLFSTALLGKLMVGLLTPNFHSSSNTDDDSVVKHYRGLHLRDCLVVGLSMMGEAEFAFVVAVFGVQEGLVDPEIYASIVLAILLSTVISPLLLRTTLALWKTTDGDDPKKHESNQDNGRIGDDEMIPNNIACNSSPKDASKTEELWLIQIECNPVPHALSDILKALLTEEAGLNIIDLRSRVIPETTIFSSLQEEGKVTDSRECTLLLGIQVYARRKDPPTHALSIECKEFDLHLERVLMKMSADKHLGRMTISSTKHTISQGGVPTLSEQLKYTQAFFSSSEDGTEV